MSAHCARLLYFCLCVIGFPIMSLAQNRLLTETELDTVNFWYQQSPQFAIDFPLGIQRKWYSSFQHLAEQVQAGQRVRAIEIRESGFKKNDWQYLKQCRDVQFISISIQTDAFLDTVLAHIGDLPVQRLRLWKYGYLQNEPSTSQEVVGLPDRITKLNRLTSITLSGGGFRLDWPAVFETLARIPSLRKLQLNTLTNFGSQVKSTPVYISGLGKMRQLTHLILVISPNMNVAPDFGELVDLKSLNLSSLYPNTRANTDSTQVLEQAIGRLRGLEELAIPVSCFSEKSSVQQLTKLRVLKLGGNMMAAEKERTMASFRQLTALEEIDLSSLQLKKLPDGICQLSRLRKLLLSGNALTELPDCLANLTKLEELDLYSNPIRNVPAWVGGFSNLSQLNVSFCQLDSLTDVFKNLKKLTLLSCSDNKLRTLPASITQLPALQNMNVAANQLETLPNDIGKLKTLTVFNASTNQLTNLPGSLTELTALKQLMLSNNKLTQLPADLGKLRHIHQLTIDNNQLQKLPESLLRLDSLQILSASNNKLRTLPEQLSVLTLLKTLAVQHNQLTQLPADIGKLNQLQRLQFESNPLQELPASIGELKKLETLSISQTKIRFLPATIGNLTRLRTIDLTDSELMALPNEIGQLQQLESLNLNKSRITELPNAIGRLKKLRTLMVNGSDDSPSGMRQLPDSIVNCVGLQLVRITNQPELDADDAFGKLLQLPDVKTITFTGTKLAAWPAINWKKTSVNTLDVSMNALTSVPTAILDAPRLMSINLRENPLPKPFEAGFMSKDQLRIALIESGQLSPASTGKPNQALANGYLQSAIQKMRQRNVSEALDDLDKAIIYAPEGMVAMVYAQRAELHFLRKNYTDAIRDYEQALAAAPKIAIPAMNNNGVGNFGNAKTQMQATWWMRKAMARGQLAQYEAALADINKATELLPPVSATAVNRNEAQLAGMLFIERGRFQLLTNHRKEALESFTLAMDAYEKIPYAEASTQLTVVELGIISHQYEKAQKALDKIPDYQRRDGIATLAVYLKTCLSIVTNATTDTQAIDSLQTYVRGHGDRIVGWSFDLFDAWLNGSDLPQAKIETLRQLTTITKERLVKME